MIQLGKIYTEMYKSFAVVNEADDDRYSHIGYGKYKLKGKENDKDAETFTKDDSGKYIPTKGNDAAKGGDGAAADSKPKVNIFDKPKPAAEPKPEPNSDNTGNYSDQTGVKSSLLKHPEFSKLINPKLAKWIASPNSKIYKQGRFMIFTDGKHEMVTTTTSPFKILKKLGKISKETLKQYTPSPDSSGDRKGRPEINKYARVLAKQQGITPQKLGSVEYKKSMAQSAVAALTDANFHDEARQLVSKLENKPEWVNKPNYPSMDDPDFRKKMDVIRKDSAGGSVYMNASDEVSKYGTDITKKAGWDAYDAVDAIAFDLKMNGYKTLASQIQSILERKTTKLIDIIGESTEFYAYNVS